MKKSRFVSVLLVNAGPTLWDLQGRFGGSADVPLSDEAVARITALAATYRGKIASLCCGPETACREASLLMSPSRPKPRELNDLREPEIGLWQGMLDTELERRYPSCFDSWRTDPASVSIPSGEEWMKASRRLVESLLKEGDRLADGEARHLAVVVRPLAWAELIRVATRRATSDIGGILSGSSDLSPLLLDAHRLRDSLAEAAADPAPRVRRPLQRLLGT